jgi:chemotaxis protein MotB
MSKTPPPIVIVKRKKTKHHNHSSAWKVAYADFVTAMMALFIVLWLLSSDEKVRKAVGGYFADPSGSGSQKGTSMGGSGESLRLGREQLQDLKKRLDSALKTVPDLQSVKDQVKITITGEGLRVELLETTQGIFFDTGSARPSEVCLSLLSVLAQETGKLPNRIAIEGHTDAKPYRGNNGYDNWDLSSERANSARRVMLARGLRGEQVTQVRGYADRILLTPSDPMNPANRRVSVIVQFEAGAKAPALKEQNAPATPPHA